MNDYNHIYVPEPSDKYDVEPPKTNVLAIVGFILSFFTGPIGGVVSLIALKQVNERGDKGKGLAVAGIIIGFIPFIAVMGILLVTIMFSAIPESTPSENNEDNRVIHLIKCSSAEDCVDNGDGTSTCKLCLDENCYTHEPIVCENFE